MRAFGLGATLLLALLALLATVLVGEGVVAAQGAEPDAASPKPRPDLVDELPREMAGFEPDVSVTRGAEHLAGLDADDPADQARAAAIERLLAATGTSLDDLTTAYALVSQNDFFAFVVAVRLEGAAPGALLEAYLPILTATLVQPRQRATTIGGHDVVVVTSQVEEGGTADLDVTVSGDTIWIVQGPDDVVAAVLAGLPPAEAPPA